MIDIRKLEKKYSSEFSFYIDSLHISPGERIALVGSNGSGKSTLLRLLGGVLKPDGGTFSFSCKLENVGYEPQDPFCYNISLEKNIRLGLPKDLKKEEAAVTAEAVMQNCRLAQLRKHKPNALSGGERQRMCFARMLVREYSVLLLDEPLSAVDVELCEEMEELLLSYCKKNNTTLLFSTHLPLQAVRLSTKMMIMNNGKIEEYGDTEKIINNPQTSFGQKFLANWRLDEC